MKTKKLPSFKCWSFLITLFFTSNSVLPQNCAFTASTSVDPVSCPGNGQITVNLSDVGSDLEGFRYSLSSSEININQSVNNVFTGLSANTYRVVVDAICNNPDGGSSTVSRVLDNVVVSSNYTSPDLGLVQGNFTSSTPYGTVPSFTCSPTGKMQLRIGNGVFPYSVVITKDGSYFRTDNFTDHMYTGTNLYNFDYKDYYTIDNLPPGYYTFHVTDGCGYSLPFVSGSVGSINETYPVNRAYIYRSPSVISDNVVRFSLLNGISGDNTYYYYGFSQSRGTDKWWEYCISIDGGSTFTPWKDVSNNGEVQETLNIPNYCNLYGKSIQVKVRDKICQKEYTKNFTISLPAVNASYLFTTDESQSTPAQYDVCGYTSQKDVLNQHTSSYYRQTNTYRANQLSSSSADFYYTPPLTVTVTNVSTGQLMSQTTQTTASYNWIQNIDVTPDMNGTTINITVTDKNGCIINNHNQVINYQERITTNGGIRYNTTWQINSSAQNGDNCGESDRKISIVRQNPSPAYLDNTIIHLKQSPQSNKYNFTATYTAATNSWVITKENPTNTASISAGNDIANNLEITAPDLISGTYVFDITTQCKTETISRNFTFPSFLSISEQPRYDINPNCGFLNVVPRAGQVQADGVNTPTYFAVVSGPPGGYPSYAVYEGGQLELTIQGNYTLRMYSNVNFNSTCGIKDTTIVFSAANIDFDYMVAYVCSQDDTQSNVNARGKSGKRPYTYTLYKDVNQTQVLASDTIGDFNMVDAQYGDKLYLKIEDACGASFVTSVDVVNLETFRKAWFENNNQKELEICQGDRALLNGISLGKVIYSWTGPNGFVDTLQNSQFYVPRGLTEAGWYYLEVENSFCPTVRDSIYLTIKPTPSVTILEDASICPGADYVVNLTAHGTGNINYTVAKESDDIVTEQIFSNQANNEQATLTVSPLSTMKVWIKNVSDDLCTYDVPEDTITIQIKSISSNCNISAAEQQVCHGGEAIMTASSNLELPYTVNWYRDKELTDKIKSEEITTAGQQSTLNISGIEKDTLFYVTAANSSFCEYKPGVSVASMNMNNGTTHINCGENIRFYDSGGPNENYKNSEDLIHTFISTTGDPVNIEFEAFHTESANFDKMYIYDGGDINSPVLAAEIGGDLNSNLPGPYVSTGDRLTIQFVSNFINNFAGWDATVGVKNKPVESVANVLDTISVKINSVQPVPIHYNSSTTLNALPSGGRGISYTYQWYTSPDGSNWTLTSVTNSSYQVYNLTNPTYYRVVVRDNSPNACDGESEAEIFLNVADIDLTLSLSTPEEAICPGQIPVTLTVRNNGSQIATNVLNKVKLPLGVSANGSQDIEFNFRTIGPKSSESIVMDVTISPSIRTNNYLIKAQIWSCDQGDNNPNTVYGNWDWERESEENDEDTLAVVSKRLVTNNDIETINDTICYGTNAVLEASTTFDYPQTFMWFSDPEGIDEIYIQTIPDASTASSRLTIPGLTKDTTVYVTFRNEHVCRYTFLTKDIQTDLVMSSGSTVIDIDQTITFYDNGGPGRNYIGGEDYTHTINSTSGDQIIITFDYFSADDSTNDILYLYDGSSTNSPLLAALSGTLPPNTSYTTTGRSLTMSFVGSETSEQPGWKAKIVTKQELKPVFVVVKPFADPATITATSKTVCPDSDVELEATSTIEYPQTFIWYSDNLLQNEVYREEVDGTNKTKSVYALTNQIVDTTYYVTVGNKDSCNLSNTGLATTNFTPAEATITMSQPSVEITGANAICVNATTTLSPVSGGIWSSSNNSIATVTNGGLVTGIATGKATFRFTDNTTGCFAETDSITVNPLPAINVINIAICSGQDVDLTEAASSPAGNSLLFYSDQAGTIVSTPEAVKNITANTTFYVKAQNDVTQCESSLRSFNVTVNPLPTVSVQDINICSGSNVNLMNAVTAVHADTLLFYSDAAGTTPVPNPLSVNGITVNSTYSVKAWNKTTECGSVPATFDILPDEAPALQLQASNSPICEGIPLDIQYTLENAIGVTITGLPADVDYTINGDLLTIGGTSSPGDYNFTITTSGQAASCQPGSEQGHITIHPEPAAAFTYEVDNTNPLMVTLTDQSAISSGSITNWSWNLGDGNSKTGQFQTHQYNSTGQYTVKLTVTSDQGCENSTEYTLTTDANIKVDFEINNDTQCIDGNNFTFTSTSKIKGTTDIKYIWDFGDGTTSNLIQVNHSYDHPGLYVVKLTIVTDEGEPTESTQTTTQVVNVRPIPTVSVQDLEICQGETVDLTSALYPVAGTTPTYYWDALEKGIVTDPANVTDVNTNTIFYVKLQYNATGCESPAMGFRVIVRNTPAIEVESINSCLGNNAVDITSAVVSSSPGSTVLFFRDPAATNQVLTPTAVSGITSSTSFFVKAAYPDTQCESKLKYFNVVPTVLPQLQTQDIASCNNGNVDLNNAVVDYTGTAVRFYEDINGEKQISNTVENIVAPVTYYARAEYDILGCKGEMKSFVVSVNPVPDVTVPNFVFCDGEAIPAYSFTGSTNGTVYRWRKVLGYDFGLMQTSGENTIPAFTALNTGIYPLEAIYEVTPVYTANGVTCTGETQEFLMTVNPMPSLAPIVDVVHCYGSIVPPYIFTGNVADADYIWEKISGNPIPAIPDSGEDFMPGFVSLASEKALTSEYKVTADFRFANKTCNNRDTINFTITLLPEVIVDISNTDQTICSGSSFEDIVFSANVPLKDVMFQWERIAGHVPGLAASGNGNIISQSLTNTGNTAVSALYNVVPVYTYNNIICEGNPKTFSVTVMPEIHTNTVTDLVYCSEEKVPAYDFGNDLSLNYTWINEDGINIGLPESGNGPFPAFSALNTGNTPITTRYKVTAAETINNSECSSEFLLSITVNPVPTMAPVSSSTLCNNDLLFINFTGNATSYQWERIAGTNVGLPLQGNGNINQVLTNTSPDILTATYKVTPVIDNCRGNGKIFDITVSPAPVLISNTDASSICSGEKFDYTAISNSNNVAFSWTRTANPDINGGTTSSENSARISETLNNTSDIPVTVTYEITLTSGSCDPVTETLTVTVNPAPTVDPVNSVALCGESPLAIEFTGNADSYRWERINGANIGLPLTGEGNMDQVLTNTSPDVLTATYRVNPVVGECYGSGKIFDITVYPATTLTSYDDAGAICSGEKFDYTAISNSNNVAFSWTRTANTDINGGATSSGNNAKISETLVNTSQTPVTVVYNVVLSSGSCASATEQITVIVNPVPTVDRVSNSILCNNSQLKIEFSGNGTAYQWERIAGANIGLPLLGEGNIEQSVTNNTSTILTATYRVIPAVSGCKGSEEIFDITVHPAPVLASDRNTGNICSGEMFNYIALSKSADVSSSWERIADPDINGGKTSSGNSNKIEEVLINNSSSPVTVMYEVSLSANACTSVTEEIMVTVNPVPVINIDFTHFLCSGTTSVTIPYTTASAATMEYSLSFSDAAIAAGFKNQSFETLPAGEIKIPVPDAVSNGYYTGVITVRTGDCTNDYPFEIRSINSFRILEQPKSLSNLCHDTYEIELTVATDQDHLYYQWFHNGQAIPGANSATYISRYDTGTDGGYYVEISNICKTLTSNIVHVRTNPVTITMEWDNVIYVEDHNHHFVTFQWYKDNALVTINGNAQYYADENGLNGTYYARCYYPDNSYIETCPVTFAGNARTRSVLYPNPSPAQSTVSVQVDSDETDMENVDIELLDIAGRVIYRIPANGNTTNMVAPEIPGNYVVRIRLNNKTLIERMIVK
jgi:hypothetical protein